MLGKNGIIPKIFKSAKETSQICIKNNTLNALSFLSEVDCSFSSTSNRSSREIEKMFDNFLMVSISGSLTSRSHLETVCLFTKSLEASSSCVSPCSILNFLIFSPILILNFYIINIYYFLSF